MTLQGSREVPAFFASCFWNSRIDEFLKRKKLSKHIVMRFRYSSHCQATIALVSLCKCTDSPEPSLLEYTKYWCIWRPRPKFRSLSLLNKSALQFIWRHIRYVSNSHVLFHLLGIVCLSMSVCGLLRVLKKNNWASTWDFQQCGMCDQQRLRPACAYTQSDQSLC